MTAVAQARDRQVNLEDQVAGTESVHWIQSLRPELRTEIKKLYRLQPRYNWVLLLYPALWALAGWAILTFPVLPVRLAGYVLIAICMNAMGILMHEGIHGNLFRNKTLDRWVGFLVAVPTLISASAYRTVHLLHHRLNRSEDDPDEFKVLTKNRTLLSIYFYTWMVIGMLAYLVHVPVTALRLGKPPERRAVLVELALMLGVYATVVGLAIRYDFLGALVHLWLLPMAIATIFGNVRGAAEHMLTDAGSPLTRARSVTSNPFVSFLMCHQNYHLDHHLFPAMPWYNLPRVHRLLRPEYDRAGSPIYRSYLVYLYDAIRLGVHGLAPEAGKNRA